MCAPGPTRQGVVNVASSPILQHPPHYSLCLPTHPFPRTCSSAVSWHWVRLLLHAYLCCMLSAKQPSGQGPWPLPLCCHGRTAAGATVAPTPACIPPAACIYIAFYCTLKAAASCRRRERRCRPPGCARPSRCWAGAPLCSAAAPPAGHGKPTGHGMAPAPSGSWRRQWRRARRCRLPPLKLPLLPRMRQ